MAANKAYDNDALLAALEGRGAEAVIPARANRVEPREPDRHPYKERNRAQAKQLRRVATRHEKMAANFLDSPGWPPSW